MNYTTWEEIIQDTDVAVEEDALSVYQAFEQVTDGRHKRGVRYSVALILTLIVLAKLARMTTPRAIAEWVRLRTGWLRKVLPVRRESFPCAATYSNVLQALDAEQVNTVVTQLLTRVGAMKRCGPLRCWSAHPGCGVRTGLCPQYGADICVGVVNSTFLDKRQP